MLSDSAMCLARARPVLEVEPLSLDFTNVAMFDFTGSHEDAELDLLNHNLEHQLLEALIGTNPHILEEHHQPDTLEQELEVLIDTEPELLEAFKAMQAALEALE